MNILGLSAHYHDSAACLVKDGRVIAASQEERFSRRKHDHSFPRAAALACLREGRMAARDIDAVVFYEKPLLKFDRILESFLFAGFSGLGPFVRAMPPWLTSRLWAEEEIRAELGHTGPVMFVPHHHAHAAAAFFPSPYPSAAVLTVDGVGEWTTAGVGIGQGGGLTGLWEQRFPHSLGLLYSAFTSYLGFEVNDGEHKVMGLASYGRPIHANLILDHLVDLKPDGSFLLNLDYFDILSGRGMTSRRFHELFDGAPRPTGAAPTRREMDIARSVQEVAERILLRMAEFARRESRSSNLCLGGGVALNCVANGRLLRESGFADIWAQPAAGDAGGALGAALAACCLLGGDRPRQDGDAMAGALLGPSYDDGEVRAALVSGGAPFMEYADTEALLEAAAGILAEGGVVAWHQGRMEFGPRALGSRSILADPGRPGMKDRINATVKFREPFRPFAPSVPVEDGARFFDGLRESPYMLFTFPVREGAGIPEATHVDGTARVQTVRRETQPLLWSLLKSFERRTGRPVLINTSLNVRGEPIVESPEQAVECLRRTGLDALVVGRCLVRREGLGKAAKRDSRDAVEAGMGAAGKRKGRLFGVSLSVFAFALCGLGVAADVQGAVVVAGFALALVLILTACFAPARLGPAAAASERLGRAIARAQATGLLGVFYLVILVPAGAVLRTVGWDPFTLKGWRKLPSAWSRVRSQIGRETLNRPY